MADIKAKDISVAQSVGASDLILGSSIAGTTANVTIETVGKYIIEQLNLSALSNTNVSNYIINLQSQINNIKRKKNVYGEFFSGNSNVYEYTGVSLTIPAGHVYIVEAVTSWKRSRPTGIALSEQSGGGRYLAKLDVDSASQTAYRSGATIVSGEKTVYAWTRRWNPDGFGLDSFWIDYIDLGYLV
jgi:hypothetical protein